MAEDINSLNRKIHNLKDMVIHIRRINGMSMQYLSDAVSGLHDKVDNLEDRTRGCNENEDEEDGNNYALTIIRQCG